MRPRLLDLFCGAGGAAMGYHRAGFDVVGVDIQPQPNYPYEFHQGDALGMLGIVARLGLPNRRGRVDAIHASPPCQRYMRSGNVDREKHPDLLGPTRELLEQTGLPWVIENVPGAPMRADLLLCGSMFGLKVRRHRWFETNWGIDPFPPFACDHSQPVAGVYGHPHGEGGAARGMLPGTLESWSEAMDIDWMSTSELALAIPPAYTEWIGCQLLEVTAGVRGGTMSEPYPLHNDPRTDERCKVCGQFLRSQGNYRYCVNDGMMQHILRAREVGGNDE